MLIHALAAASRSLIAFSLCLPSREEWFWKNFPEFRGRFQLHANSAVDLNISSHLNSGSGFNSRRCVRAHFSVYMAQHHPDLPLLTSYPDTHTHTSISSTPSSLCSSMQLLSPSVVFSAALVLEEDVCMQAGWMLHFLYISFYLQVAGPDSRPPL